MRRRLIVLILLSLAIPELTLQIFDPFKVKPYFADLTLLFSQTVADDAREYVLPAGVYPFSNWTATILDDHSRLVPATRHSHCTIALVGDSVTFGYGVSDSDTWANRIAQRFREVEIINASLIGYNAAQAYSIIQTTPARAFLFTLVWNDADIAQQATKTPVPAFPLLYAYGWVLSEQFRNVAHDYTAFDTALEAMQRMPNVAIVGFEGDALAERAGVDVVPMWTQTNSPVDGHADAAGNVEIADAMTPYVAQLIEATCPT